MCMRQRLRLAFGLPLLVLLAPQLLSSCSAPNAVPTSAIPTATHDDLRLSTDYSSYGVHSPIGIVLVNAGAANYFSIDGHSGCTVVQLQRYDANQRAWLAVDGCTPGGQPRVLLIPAGIREPFTLAPTSSVDPNAWQTGLYRLATSYSPNSDGVSAARVAYSAGFVIQV